MNRYLRSSSVSGSIDAPASKSMAQRAIACALLANGDSLIHCPGYSDDALAATRIARSLGAKIVEIENGLCISGGFASGDKVALIEPTSDTLDCGEAGLSMRMFAPIASLYEKPLTLLGTGTLVKRPLDAMEAPLRALGAECLTTGGYAPVRVRGPLKGGRIELDGSLSSQFITGLLIALSRAESDSELIVKNLKSKPYIDMTIECLSAFGIRIEHEKHERFIIKGNQRFIPREYRVEGDWSGAAILLVAGAIASSEGVFVSNLRADSNQADRAILKALELAGASPRFEKGGVSILKAPLTQFEFDATDCPDLFLPLSALAASCAGITKLKGATRLAHKESDRAKALSEECAKLGIRVWQEGDYLFVEGGKASGGSIDARGDHRIAMAAAIMALNASGAVEIRGAECVAKSYPEFFEDLATLGAIVG